MKVAEFEKEFEKYRERGFPMEIAIAKAIAHSIAPNVPGVWRTVIPRIKEESAKREQIINATPEKYKEEVKELLACTREIKEMRNGQVGWGWFFIHFSCEDWCYILDSANSTLPEIINGEYEIIKDSHGYSAKIKPPKDDIIILRTNSNPEAHFEIIGIITACYAWLLEVRLSERGKKAIDNLMRKLV